VTPAAYLWLLILGLLAPIGNLTSAQIATVRTGIDPNGHRLSKQNAWQLIGKVSDKELGCDL
jgi:hypothetical protein